MKSKMILGLLVVAAMTFAVIPTPAVAVSLEAPGGTPGAPPAPAGPAATGQPNVPGAQATANAIAGTGKPTLYRGTISAVDASSLSLTLADGSSVVIGLSPDTRIVIPGHKDQGGGLLEGLQVIAWTFPDADGRPLASKIIVIPAQPSRVHRVGTVTEYLPGSSITILGADGNPYTFALTSATKILPAERAGELAVGSLVTVIAPRDPGALGLTATGIVVHPAAGQ